VAYLDAYFSGRVQGVGFRYSTLQIARGYEAAGYVSNLVDGRVRLEVEGDGVELTAFLEEIEDQLSVFIRETEVRRGERPRSFQDFLIV